MSGSASCTVFMHGTGGAGKCSENKQFGNCKNYSREKDRKKTQNKKEADTGTGSAETYYKWISDWRRGTGGVHWTGCIH